MSNEIGSRFDLANFAEFEAKDNSHSWLGYIPTIDDKLDSIPSYRLVNIYSALLHEGLIAYLCSEV